MEATLQNERRPCSTQNWWMSPHLSQVQLCHSQPISWWRPPPVGRICLSGVRRRTVFRISVIFQKICPDEVPSRTDWFSPRCCQEGIRSGTLSHCRSAGKLTRVLSQQDGVFVWVFLSGKSCRCFPKGSPKELQPRSQTRLTKIWSCFCPQKQGSRKSSWKLWLSNGTVSSLTLQKNR